MLPSALAVASTDGYLVGEKQLSELNADKHLRQLPAAKVNPSLEAAKTAQRNASCALTEAEGRHHCLIASTLLPGRGGG